jgi:holo-[acyl-carrier protein] synthase
MTRGLGIDLVNIERVAKAYARFGERFARRILTEEELDLFARAKQPARFLAMRFAAKEACAKALGTGFKQNVAPTLIGVRQELSGKPLLYLVGAALTRAESLGIVAGHVSMTDEGEYAAAVVVLEGRAGAAEPGSMSK